jgi:hypothetical protein
LDFTLDCSEALGLGVKECRSFFGRKVFVVDFEWLYWGFIGWGEWDV